MLQRKVQSRCTLPTHTNSKKGAITLHTADTHKLKGRCNHVAHRPHHTNTNCASPSCSTLSAPHCWRHTQPTSTCRCCLSHPPASAGAQTPCLRLSPAFMRCCQNDPDTPDTPVTPCGAGRRVVAAAAAVQASCPRRLTTTRKCTTERERELYIDYGVLWAAAAVQAPCPRRSQG